MDLLGEFGVSVIAIVNHYKDEMCNQLIKHHVIDYVLKDNKVNSTHICDFIFRAHKNCNVHVLVVDDSMVSRFVIVRGLKLQRFEVLQASNGLEALDILQKIQGSN